VAAIARNARRNAIVERAGLAVLASVAADSDAPALPDHARMKKNYDNTKGRKHEKAPGPGISCLRVFALFVIS
jgi:hypothetical protein